MEFRKIKTMAKSNKGNRSPRSQAQISAAIKTMILKNPMKREECRRRLSEVKKGKRPPCPFPKDNELWKLRKKFNPQAAKQIP